MSKQQQLDIHEDIWIPTQCGRCFSNCAIDRRECGFLAGLQGWGLRERGIRSATAVRSQPPERSFKKDKPGERSARRPAVEGNLLGGSPRRDHRKGEANVS
jgi:hypothetical protein